MEDFVYVTKQVPYMNLCGNSNNIYHFKCSRTRDHIVSIEIDYKKYNDIHLWKVLCPFCSEEMHIPYGGESPKISMPIYKWKEKNEDH